jgi:hypothetical protein
VRAGEMVQLQAYLTPPRNNDMNEVRS